MKIVLKNWRRRTEIEWPRETRNQATVGKHVQTSETYVQARRTLKNEMYWTGQLNSKLWDMSAFVRHAHTEATWQSHTWLYTLSFNSNRCTFTPVNSRHLPALINIIIDTYLFRADINSATDYLQAWSVLQKKHIHGHLMSSCPCHLAVWQQTTVVIDTCCISNLTYIAPFS